MTNLDFAVIIRGLTELTPLSTMYNDIYEINWILSWSYEANYAEELSNDEMGQSWNKEFKIFK
jgi:hypothetical protein